MQARDRLIIAIDRSSRDEILRMVDALRGTVGLFKIGLQAFLANGPSIVREIVDRGEKVFLDLKVHDIPNTAERAVAEHDRVRPPDQTRTPGQALPPGEPVIIDGNCELPGSTP